MTVGGMGFIPERLLMMMMMIEPSMSRRIYIIFQHTFLYDLCPLRTQPGAALGCRVCIRTSTPGFEFATLRVLKERGAWHVMEQ